MSSCISPDSRTSDEISVRKGKAQLDFSGLNSHSSSRVDLATQLRNAPDVGRCAETFKV